MVVQIYMYLMVCLNARRKWIKVPFTWSVIIEKQKWNKKKQNKKKDSLLRSRRPQVPYVNKRRRWERTEIATCRLWKRCIGGWPTPCSMQIFTKANRRVSPRAYKNNMQSVSWWLMMVYGAINDTQFSVPWNCTLNEKFTFIRIDLASYPSYANVG